MQKDIYILEELEKVRIDCMYGKKKHYNARDRYSKNHTRLGIALVIIQAIMGTSIFLSLSNSALLLAKVLIGIFVVINAVLIGLQTFFKFEKRAFNHKVTADKYLELMKKSQRLISYHKDRKITIDEIKDEIEKLNQEIQNIHEEELDTSPEDYEKAQKGIMENEEVYTEMRM